MIHQFRPIVKLPSLTSPNNNSRQTQHKPISQWIQNPLCTIHFWRPPILRPHCWQQNTCCSQWTQKSSITTSPNSSTTSLPTLTTALSTTQATWSSLASPMPLTLTWSAHAAAPVTKSSSMKTTLSPISTAQSSPWHKSSNLSLLLPPNPNFPASFCVTRIWYTSAIPLTKWIGCCLYFTYIPKTPPPSASPTTQSWTKKPSQWTCAFGGSADPT